MFAQIRKEDFMYNSQLTTDRIRQAIKEKNISMSKLNEICNLSKNAISSAGKSQEGMKAKNLYMVANCLDVSVDYLLGRTDDPHTIGGHSIKTGNINGDNNANINAIKEKNCSDISELFEIISSLSIIDRAKVVLFIDELKNK